MIIGVPKEVKNNENRVGLTEEAVHQLVLEGHKLIVEKGAGLASSIYDKEYEKSGAEIVSSIKEVYDRSEMIIKVKEPLPQEYPLLRENQILYTYLHLAPQKELTQVLCDKKVKAVAYETIEDDRGVLPLLTPMSEVAGRMATQVGAFYLQKGQGGKGILLGGATGVKRAEVVIVGGGIVGSNAAKMAVGLGADVTILDIDHQRLEYLDNIFHSRVKTLYSNASNIGRATEKADLLIGAVLITGHRAPCLVTREMISTMPKGGVVVDVAVDQGGCIETCRPTSHADPVYYVDDIIHYCVPNMPGVVPRTSTYALTNATMKYGALIASMGLEKAVLHTPELQKGVNVYKGHVVYKPVAKDLGFSYKNLKELI